MPATEQSAKRRRQQIAAIQIARGQLDLEESAYRDMIERVSGAHGQPARSSAKCNERQRRAILDELRRLGAVRPSAPTRQGRMKPAGYPGKPHNFHTSAMPDMITKIEAMLADMGLSWAYADAIAKRQCGIARVAWVRKPDQLRGIIAALDVEQYKRAANEYIDRTAKRLGMSDAQLADLAGKAPANWRRNRVWLKLVCDHLRAREAMLDAKEGSEAQE